MKIAPRIQDLIVHCPFLWVSKDSMVSHPRWGWVGNLLYWLEGLR